MKPIRYNRVPRMLRFRFGWVGAESAFTLVEMLVSMAILTMVMVMMVSMVDQTSITWRNTTSRIEQFRDARTCFEAITRCLSQATLNTYLDYLDENNAPRTSANSATFTPARYARQSELRFISGPMSDLDPGISASSPTHGVFFVAPFGFVNDSNTYGGLDTLLNTWGFFVAFGPDQSMPTILSDIFKTDTQKRYRFRLMELMSPSESMPLYKYTAGHGDYADRTWFTDLFAAKSPPVYALAENIIALIILPKLTKSDEDHLRNTGIISASTPVGTALAPQYKYDSTDTKSIAALNPKNQLPSTIQVTMVAVDEASFARYQKGTTMPDLGLSGLFQNASSYDDDLASLEKTLVDAKLNYKIFTTTVALKGAKWSFE